MKKALLVVFCMALFAATSFAKGLGIYGKLDIGYAKGSARVNVNEPYYEHSGRVGFHGFEAMPAIGFCPEATSFPGQPFDLTFEAALDLIFADSSYSDWYGTNVTVINPSATAFFNWHFENTSSKFLKNFVPYGGAGVSFPIQMVDFSYASRVYDENGNFTGEYNRRSYSSTVVGLDLVFLLGARYAFTEKFEVNAENGFNCISMNNFFFRVGALYRFK
ncbi:MAG: hypothetical protein K6B43_02985 [Treponema sp.]|nr:hypothetical protein [Treponema sp.]